MIFASGVRSILRQDPDIILVGEVRDEDTANMAFRAAMTGHQVFTTLHTNSSMGAIPRLLDIGIRPEIMAGNIIGIMAQRLVRKLCNSCKEPYEASELERRLMGAKTSSKPFKIYQAKGCEHCDYQGYAGRIALMEILKFNQEVDEMISAGASLKELNEMAVSKDFKTLADMGIRKIREGITSLDEVSRVIDLTERVD